MARSAIITNQSGRTRSSIIANQVLRSSSSIVHIFIVRAIRNTRELATVGNFTTLTLERCGHAMYRIRGRTEKKTAPLSLLCGQLSLTGRGCAEERRTCWWAPSKSSAEVLQLPGVSRVRSRLGDKWIPSWHSTTHETARLMRTLRIGYTISIWYSSAYGRIVAFVVWSSAWMRASSRRWYTRRRRAGTEGLRYTQRRLWWRAIESKNWLKHEQMQRGDAEWDGESERG